MGYTNVLRDSHKQHLFNQLKTNKKNKIPAMESLLISIICS